MRGARFVIIYEVRLWVALFRWVFRRPPRVTPGTTTHAYAGGARLLFGAFIGISAIEIPILHLILPWPAARVASLIVGGYGLFWMIGLLATLHTNPHLVGPDGLRIRNSSTVNVPIGWNAIAGMRVRRRSLPPGGQTQVETAGDERVLSLGVGGQTSVDVLFSRPVTVPVKKALGEPVTQIRFHADDPEALVEAAGAYLRAAASKD